MNTPSPSSPGTVVTPDAAPGAPQPSQPSELARRLGYAGLAPFVGGALFIWLLAGRIDAEPLMFVVQAVTGYAALIVAFLGGIPWGLSMQHSRAHDRGKAMHRQAFRWGVGYCLSAWIALLMPPHAGLVVLGAALIACYLSDRKRYPQWGVAGWLTLRFRLTVVASLSCFLAAAQI